MHDTLERLLGDTRARCVLLITAAGYPVDSAGKTYGLHLPTLGALIAATYAAAAELAVQLGNASDFRASHHQGPDSDIYTCEVNKDLLLATVFGEESQAGAVWLFAKRAAAALDVQQPKESQPISLGVELTKQLEAQIDSLFDNGPANHNG
jgi:predicted regulator of Ras-like GTPase activity (Roadblock/LC7/MglB family)